MQTIELSPRGPVLMPMALRVGASGSHPTMTTRGISDQHTMFSNSQSTDYQ